MRVLVIGGTLFIGRGLVTALTEAGHDVTIAHRKPGHPFGAQVSEIIADRNDAKAMRSAIAGRTFDIVYDNVYDWNRGTTGKQVASTAEAVAGDTLQRYVFISSVAAYGDGLNHEEDDELAPGDHPEDYVRNKAGSERALFRMHARSGFPVVTIRPPYIYGPGNPYYREAFFWDRMRDNRLIIVPGDGSRLMQFVFVDDVVRALLEAGSRPDIQGQAFNIGDPKPITQNDLIAAFARVRNVTAHTIHIPRERIAAAGGHPLGPKLYFGFYYDMPPITMRTEKAQQLIDFDATPFDEGLHGTYLDYFAHHKPDRSNYAFEDELINRSTH